MNSSQLLERVTPEQRLLLRAVLGSDDAARAAFAEWRERVEILLLPDESHRLLPLLARRMGDLAPDDPVRALVRGAYRLSWVKNRLITRDAATLATALQQEDIPVIALKGAALVGYYGDDWGARPMYDVDLLVPCELVSRAFAVLCREGWRPRDDVSAEWFGTRVVPRRHSMAFSRGIEEQLDLHWHVLSNSLGPHADDRFWANRSIIDLGGVEVGVLRRADLLLHVIAHGTQPSGPNNVQWVADAVHVLRAGATEELAGPLATEARRHGLVTTARSALEVIDTLLDEPAVRPLVRELSSVRSPVLERLTTTDGALASPLRTIAGLLLRHGGGGESLRRRTSGLARHWFDLDHVRRPAFYIAYVMAGCRPRVAAGARRRWGSFVRTSRPSAVVVRDGVELDFASPAVADRHAGPGWWKLDGVGLGSNGAEARLVLDLQEWDEREMELRIEASSFDRRPRPIEVRVNERVVARATVAPIDATTELRVHVPAAVVRRFHPLEIAFLSSPSSGLRLTKGRVRLRLARVTLTPCDSSPDGARPAPPAGSHLGAG